MRGIHRSPVVSFHKRPVPQKTFPWRDVFRRNHSTRKHNTVCTIFDGNFFLCVHGNVEQACQTWNNLAKATSGICIKIVIPKTPNFTNLKLLVTTWDLSWKFDESSFLPFFRKVLNKQTDKGTAVTAKRSSLHDDVIKWKHFPRYWPFVWGIHRSPVNSPHKGKWRGALMLPLICTRINGWVNNGEAGDLRRIVPFMTSL